MTHPRRNIKRKRKANKRMLAYNDTPIVQIRRAANMVAKVVVEYGRRERARPRPDFTSGGRPSGEWVVIPAEE